MYGVVLWSDRNDKKAVIWCEDHGDLAYYGGHTGGSVFDGPVLDAGDLVHFQLADACGAAMRMAHNPELVSECHAPAIAHRLRSSTGAGDSTGKSPACAEAKRESKILPFPMAISA